MRRYIFKCCFMALLSLMLIGCHESHEIPENKHELLNFMNENVTNQKEFSINLNVQLDIFTEIAESATTEEVEFKDKSVYNYKNQIANKEKNIQYFSLFEGANNENDIEYYDLNNNKEYVTFNTNENYEELTNYDLSNPLYFISNIDRTEILQQLEFSNKNSEYYILSGKLKNKCAKNLWRGMTIDGTCKWDIFFDENTSDIPVEIFINKQTYLVSHITFDLEEMLNNYFKNHSYYGIENIFNIKEHVCEITFNYVDIPHIELPMS